MWSRKMGCSNRRKRQLRIKEFNSRKRIDYKYLDSEDVTYKTSLCIGNTIACINLNDYDTTITNSMISSPSLAINYNFIQSNEFSKGKKTMKQRLNKVFLDEHYKRNQIDLDSYETLKQMLDSELESDIDLACSIIDTYPDFV
jgi:hypothetical protein